MLVLADRWQTVEHLAFGPGTHLAVAYSSGLAVWDAATGQQRTRLPYSSHPGGRIAAAALLIPPDGAAVYADARSGGLHRFRLPDLAGEPVGAGPGYCYGAALSADGRRLVCSGWWPGKPAGYRLVGFRPDGDGPPAEDWSAPAAGVAIALAFFPDGGRYAAVDHGDQHTTHYRPSLRVAVRRWPGVDLLASAWCGRSDVGQVVVSPDGGRIAVRAGTHLLVWPADLTGDPVRAATGGRRHFTGLAFHPSGRWLAATSNDATVKLYDPATLDLARSYTWGVGKLKGLAFSADGALAAAAGEAGRVVVWDVDE